jgi:hypothetical protein
MSAEALAIVFTVQVKGKRKATTVKKNALISVIAL